MTADTDVTVPQDGATAPQDGTFVILYASSDQAYGLKLEKGALLNCTLGTFAHDDIIGTPYGSLLREVSPWPALRKKQASAAYVAAKEAEKEAGSAKENGAENESLVVHGEDLDKSTDVAPDSKRAKVDKSEDAVAASKKDTITTSSSDKNTTTTVSTATTRAISTSTTRRSYLVLLKARPELITCSLPHRTQIIYHTDISLILSLLDCKPGDVVVESGTGSGSLTSSLAAAVAPTGRVFTFEYHLERFRQAREEFRVRSSANPKMRMSQVIIPTWADACINSTSPSTAAGSSTDAAAGAEQQSPASSTAASPEKQAAQQIDADATTSKGEEQEQAATEEKIAHGFAPTLRKHFSTSSCSKGLADSVFLDLPQPWEAVDNVKEVLRENGKLCVFSPCVEQVARTCELLRNSGFADVRTFESLCKGWGVSKKHPGQSMQLPMRGHTSYVTVATLAVTK
ncbi:unnamed protein product [Amoebophrya sp. A25]|nr:unnamed protein product [Amoebophrya sp. A25]|eukprot:GSA25T00018184001.1